MSDILDFAKFEFNDDIYSGHLQGDYTNRMIREISEFIGEEVDLLAAISKKIDMMESEKKVMALYLSGDYMSFRNMAEILGMSRSGVHDAYVRVIKKVKKYIIQEKKNKKMNDQNKKVVQSIENYYSILLCSLEDLLERCSRLDSSPTLEQLVSDISLRKSYLGELRRIYVERAKRDDEKFDYSYATNMVDLFCRVENLENE